VYIEVLACDVHRSLQQRRWRKARALRCKDQHYCCCNSKASASLQHHERSKQNGATVIFEPCDTAVAPRRGLCSFNRPFLALMFLEWRRQLVLTSHNI
jgi:hypothetical protein